MNPDCFVFEAYQLDAKSKRVTLRYRLDDAVHFEEVLTLPEGEWRELPAELLERALFNLHLIAGISYYKTHCPKKIVIESGTLSKKEADFWNKLYTQGLGEFFYQNDIDFRRLVQFPYDEEQVTQAVRQDLSPRCLLPLGGGKDSIVAGEMLKGLNKEFEVFNLGDYPIVRQVSEVMGKEPMISTRQLSENLFEMNKAGALNGHVPISAYIAFLSVLVALLYDFKFIVLANERSANEGNVEFYGEEINHQYSKSFEFEKDFHDYVADFICPEVYYFSLLRPLYEIKIAQFFSHYGRAYLDVFTSCNRNFKVREKSAKANWCGECAKCAFVYAILAPFFTQDEMTNIFGKDLLSDPALEPLMDELRGKTEVKPFDCVGTPEEMECAIDWMEGRQSKYSGKLMHVHEDEHLVPPTFWPVLEQPSVLILGYGREGRASRDYFLKKNYLVDVADANPVEVDGFGRFGAGYMDTLPAYDIIVKSPGIPWTPELQVVADRVTSGTELFFQNLDESNTIVGITGSKGKSTVSTLLYELLKANGETVKLVGNIGEAALTHVKDKDMIFVMEMSSYQLDGLKVSPHVAIFTSFFPDHLNVHGNLEAYFEAKANIARHQTQDDLFFYPTRYADILGRIDTAAQRVMVDPGRNFPTPLLGQHNQDNIALVEAVAHVFDITEEIFLEVIANFQGLPHRLEYVGKVKGVEFYDDAISTTPESTMAAMDVFEDRIGTIFLGGQDRGYNFKALGKKLAEYGVKNVVLLPDTGEQIFESFPEGYMPRVLRSKDMDEAIDFAIEHSGKGFVTLLSTASPSYSLYKNFIEQGEDFKRAIKKHQS